MAVSIKNKDGNIETWYYPANFAELNNISLQTVYNRIDAGVYEKRQIGKKTVVRKKN
jgi:hypothetical protein